MDKNAVKIAKNRRILQDVGFEYLDDMFPTKASRELALEYPTLYNVEHLVELAIAKVGGLTFVDGDGYDHSDFTETKAVSVLFKPNKASPGCHRWEISNVARNVSGKLKAGDLRVAMFNPVNDTLRYFFIPHIEWPSLGINYHPTTSTGRIFGSWNREDDRYTKITDFEVDSFHTLANTKTTFFE